MLALPKELYPVVQEAGAQPVRLVLPETHVFVVRKAFGKVGWGTHVSLRSPAIDVVDC